LRSAVLQKYPAAAVKEDAASKTTDGKPLTAFDVRNDKGV
jgi:hypothetical protein